MSNLPVQYFRIDSRSGCAVFLDDHITDRLRSIVQCKACRSFFGKDVSMPFDTIDVRNLPETWKSTVSNINMPVLHHDLWKCVSPYVGDVCKVVSVSHKGSVQPSWVSVIQNYSLRVTYFSKPDLYSKCSICDMYSSKKFDIGGIADQNAIAGRLAFFTDDHLLVVSAKVREEILAFRKVPSMRFMPIKVAPLVVK